MGKNLDINSYFKNEKEEGDSDGKVPCTRIGPQNFDPHSEHVGHKLSPPESSNKVPLRRGSHRSSPPRTSHNRTASRAQPPRPPGLPSCR